MIMPIVSQSLFLVGCLEVVETLCGSFSRKEIFENKSIYFKYDVYWIYMKTFLNLRNVRKNVIKSSLCIISRNFYPEKNAELLTVMTDSYIKHDNPINIIESYLTLCSTGKLGDCFRLSDYDNNEQYIKQSNFKRLVTIFGAECVVLWNAVMLKKRILIISNDLTELSTTVCLRYRI